MPLYDGYISYPREGELYRRFRSVVREGTVPPAWSVNIDGPKDIRIQGLRLLWNATPRSPTGPKSHLIGAAGAVSDALPSSVGSEVDGGVD